MTPLISLAVAALFALQVASHPAGCLAIDGFLPCVQAQVATLIDSPPLESLCLCSVCVQARGPTSCADKPMKGWVKGALHASAFTSALMEYTAGSPVSCAAMAVGVTDYPPMQSVCLCSICVQARGPTSCTDKPMKGWVKGALHASAFTSALMEYTAGSLVSCAAMAVRAPWAAARWVLSRL